MTISEEGGTTLEDTVMSVVPYITPVHGPRVGPGSALDIAIKHDRAEVRTVLEAAKPQNTNTADDF